MKMAQQYSLKTEYKIGTYYDGWWGGVKAVAVYVWYTTIERTWCKWFGHRWNVTAHISPDSGSEDFCCKRCHLSDTIIWY